MPRYSDNWAVSKALFDYTAGGSCACCSFPTLFDPNGLKGLISSVSDLETDAANAEYNAAVSEESPWPPDMRDSIWADRVKVRYKMKKEMADYRAFWDEVGNSDGNGDSDGNGEGVENLKQFCMTELGAVGLRKIFQMARSEVTDMLSNRYSACSAYGTVMCAVVEQVANFKMTKYEVDSRGLEEIELEKVLQYNRFGGFVIEGIVSDVSCSNDNDVKNEEEKLEINQDVLDVFLASMKSLIGPKLLERGPSTSKSGKNGNDEDEGGADDADAEEMIVEKGSKKKKGPSFRSDRRIVRLIILRHWADQIIRKYRETR